MYKNYCFLSFCVVLNIWLPKWISQCAPVWHFFDVLLLEEFADTKGVIRIVVSTSRSFPNSRLITGFVTRLTWRVPLVEQELFTLPEHLNSPPVFSGVRVTRSLVLYVCFVDRCLSSCAPGIKSWMRKEPGSVYDKWNIFVVICDTDIP
jgi:hypothetical protein